MKLIVYWSATVIVGLVLLSGGVAQLIRRPENVAGMAHLGYPVYMLTILGFWKIAGAMVLFAPGLGRLKEWAYAGAFFDFTGAVASHIASGDGAGTFIWPGLFAAFTLVSWALRPAGRMLGTLLPERARG